MLMLLDRKMEKINQNKKKLLLMGGESNGKQTKNKNKMKLSMQNMQTQLIN